MLTSSGPTNPGSRSSVKTTVPSDAPGQETMICGSTVTVALATLSCNIKSVSTSHPVNLSTTVIIYITPASKSFREALVPQPK